MVSSFVTCSLMGSKHCLVQLPPCSQVSERLFSIWPLFITCRKWFLQSSKQQSHSWIVQRQYYFECSYIILIPDILSIICAFLIACMSLLSPASVMWLICFYHLCVADTQKDRGAVTAAAPSRSCGQGHLCGVGGDARVGMPRQLPAIVWVHSVRLWDNGNETTPTTMVLRPSQTTVRPPGERFVDVSPGEEYRLHGLPDAPDRTRRRCGAQVTKLFIKHMHAAAYTLLNTRSKRRASKHTHTLSRARWHPH